MRKELRAMEIIITEMKRCVLVSVSGRVDGSTAPDLDKAIKSLQDNGHFRIVLDMGGVTFLSSAGIGVLIGGWKTSRRWNRGDVRLANLPPKIMDVLELTGLDKHFTQFDSTVEAVGSF